MCACEPGFTCSGCAGTPFDPMYLLDEPDPITPAEFDLLTERDLATSSYALWGIE